MELITADDIIQEHVEQDIIQCFIHADSTDADIDLIVMLVEAGLNKVEIRAYLTQYGCAIN